MGIFAYRYTTSIANASQLTPENSLGGYISTNNIYSSASLTSPLTISATSIDVSTLPTETSGLAQAGLEIINYAAIDNTNSKLLTVTRGKVPNSVTSGFPHKEDETVWYLPVSGLFDPKFDNLYTQYRCIAVKSLYNFTIGYVKPILIQDSDSDVDIDIGIEVPKHDYNTGILTQVTSTTVVENVLFSGSFADNYFDDSLFRLTSGAASGGYATIESYDSDGTFVLSTAISGMVAGDAFEIEPAKSQSVINQLTAPVDNGRFFGFFDAGGSDEVYHDSIREHGNSFIKNDVFYLWIKRSLTANVKGKANTGSVILISYVETGS